MIILCRIPLYTATATITTAWGSALVSSPLNMSVSLHCGQSSKQLPSLRHCVKLVMLCICLRLFPCDRKMARRQSRCYKVSSNQIFNTIIKRKNSKDYSNGKQKWTYYWVFWAILSYWASMNYWATELLWAIELLWATVLRNSEQNHTKI